MRDRFITVSLVALLAACGSRTGSLDSSTTTGFEFAGGDAGSANAGDDVPQMAECPPEANSLYVTVAASYRAPPAIPGTPDTWLYTNRNSSFSGTSSQLSATVSATYLIPDASDASDASNESCGVSFYTNTSTPVVPGTYDFFGYGQRLDFDVDCFELGYLCQATSGSLTITSDQPAAAPTVLFALTSFAAYFDVHCDNSYIGELQGCVRYTSETSQ